MARRARWTARAAVLLGALAAGCATTPEGKSLARRDDLDTAPITHVVLVQLKDPTRAEALIADCDRALPAIPGVSAYACGAPLDTGRSSVSGDYDVGVYVGFRTEADYRAYVEDARHLALVERWRDGWKSVRTFDMLAGAPTRSRTAPATNQPTPAAPDAAKPAANAEPPATTPAPASPPAPPAPPAATPPGSPPNSPSSSASGIH